MKSKSDQQPYFRLWKAVLIRAIQDLYPRKGQIYLSTLHWFSSKSIDIGSYLWICSILEIDPSYLKTRIFEALKYNNNIITHRKWDSIVKILITKYVSSYEEEEDNTGVPSWWREV